MPASRRWWRPQWLLGSPAEISIIVTEVAGSKYRVESADGSLILKASAQPFHATARILLKRGHDPNSTLLMRRARSDVVAMRGVLAEVATMSVRESPSRGPEAGRYVPFKQANAVSAVDRTAIISAGVL